MQKLMLFFIIFFQSPHWQVPSKCELHFTLNFQSNIYLELVTTSFLLLGKPL